MRISALGLLGLAVTMSAGAAGAQTPADSLKHVDVAITYSADRTNVVNGGSFWMQGGSGDLAVRCAHGVSVVGSVTGLHSGSISSSQVPLSLMVYVFGPRFRYVVRRNAEGHALSVFGQALGGAAHGFDSVFPASMGANPGASGFAFEAGGGVDMELSRRLGVRLVQAEWLRTGLPSSENDAQNHLQLNAGLVLHF